MKEWCSFVIFSKLVSAVNAKTLSVLIASCEPVSRGKSLNAQVSGISEVFYPSKSPQTQLWHHSWAQSWKSQDQDWKRFELNQPEQGIEHYRVAYSPVGFPTALKWNSLGKVEAILNAVHQIIILCMDRILHVLHHSLNTLVHLQASSLNLKYRIAS